MHTLSSRPVKLDHGVGRWGHAFKKQPTHSVETLGRSTTDSFSLLGGGEGGGTGRGREIVADGSAQNLL